LRYLLLQIVIDNHNPNGRFVFHDNARLLQGLPHGSGRCDLPDRLHGNGRFAKSGHSSFRIKSEGTPESRYLSRYLRRCRYQMPQRHKLRKHKQSLGFENARTHPLKDLRHGSLAVDVPDQESRARIGNDEALPLADEVGGVV
jgi:hypothetical protein